MDANDIAQSALAAQWVSAWAAVAGVAVAGLFGFLTLFNFRLGKQNQRLGRDNQERSTWTAANESATSEFSDWMSQPSHTGWLITHTTGESYAVVNNSTTTAFGVRIEGLTDLDKRRLSVDAPQPRTLEPGEALEFVLVSRLSLSGPANLVVTFSIDAEGVHTVRKVLLVPAP